MSGGQFALFILLFLMVVVSLMAVIISLYNRVRNKEQELREVKTDLESELSHPEFLQRVLDDPDVFLELERFTYLQKEKDFPAIDYFFDELAARTRLEMVGRYKELVPFAPEIHRSREHIRPGEYVEIVVPGWKYKEEIIRFPIVQRTEER